MPAPRKKNKNPPIMSHEFVIQNHADILACIAIVIVMGLMSQKTAAVSKVFVFLQYGIKNETDSESEIETPANEFERGLWDIFTVFFSALMIAVFHAVVQEYGIDKYSRRLHLSKIKTSKFNESGHLVVWCFISTIWGIHDLYHAGFHQNINFLWKDYPHTVLKWENKLYFISQIGYWLHLYPELYFLRAKREEIPARIQYYTLHLIFIVAAYTLHFWRLAVVLLTIHYLAEGLFHGSRLLYYAEINDRSELGFTIWRSTFIAVRLLIALLGALTFVYGLPGLENKGLNAAEGNFNSFFIRVSSLASLVLTQFWLLYLFFGLLLRRSKEEEQEKEAAEKIKHATAAASEQSVKKTPKAKKSRSENANGLTNRSKVKKN